MPRERSDALLVYGVLPTWTAAGILDWWCHRQTDIAEHASTHESLLHLLMGAQAGGALLLAVFSEATPTTTAVTAAAAIAHEATVIWDVAYAAPRRFVSQTEQHVHAFMEVLPFVIAGITASMAAPPTARGVRPRRPALSGAASIGTLATLAVLGIGPHVEEFVRCWRRRPTVIPQR